MWVCVSVSVFRTSEGFAAICVCGCVCASTEYEAQIPG